MAHNKETPKLSEDSANLLLQELDSLHSAIIELSCTEAYANDGTNLMAIVRLLPGATRQEWLEISEKYNLGQWLAIDLKKNTTRNLLELYEQMQQLAFQKDHDPLTGLPNRRMFMRTFQVELERQERQRSSLSLVSLDLDHFKKVNDSWGHAVGDIVLKGLADALSKSKRPYDTAARLGGEEFALLLPGASEVRARAITQRILNTFRTTPFHSQDGTEFFVTFSAGIASIKGEAAYNMEKILNVADKALYEAKNTGRNKIIATQVLGDEEFKKSMVHSDEKHFLFFGKHI